MYTGPVAGDEAMAERASRGGGQPEEFFCAATFLPVRRWRHVPGFLMLSRRVTRQVREAPGMVMWAVRANFPKKHFWTLSVWKDRASANAFVKGEPHATAVRRFPGLAGQGAAFAEWRSTSPKVSWEEALERLKSPTFYYRGTKG